jgi:predicted TIM-barrel fold metal-dependent hydrolase
VVTSHSPGSIWANAAVIATFAGALVFVASYAWRTRGAWRDSAVGRNVMALMAVILVVSALAVAAIIWGTNWPHRDAVRFVAWSLVAACIWWRVVILWRVQRRKE